MISLSRIKAERRNKTADVERDERHARLIKNFEKSGAGWFWETDQDGNLTYLSDKVAAILEADGVRTIGHRLTEVFKPDTTAGEMSRALGFHLSARTGFSERRVRGMKGLSDSWWSISGQPWHDDHGNFCGFVGMGSDLTLVRQTEAEIKRLALCDSLTGLANRASMRSCLADSLLSNRRTGQHTSLILLDLDQFKTVNDTLGHYTGDELLRQVSIRLRRAVGEVGLVGRIGGDEFEIILPDECTNERLEQYAASILHTISQPYLINDSPISIGCSIGIAISPKHGDDAETLIRNADLALYAAKAAGRGRHQFFSDALLAKAQKRKSMEDDLRQALLRNQIHLKYQQVVSSQTDRIVGYEALIRWNHPVIGEISPSEFIPIAEECGLIEPLGEWVLRTAIADLALWPETMRVAINVSPIQFANPNLPAIVTSAIAASGVAPDRVELEITEGVFLNDDVWSDHMFKALKRVGVRLALDDFGTGYSSLGYLKNAPFDKIKIDQSFVRGAIVPGTRNAAIIRAIVMLANTLGMETTAEGVEQCDEIAFIRELGCSHIQGFVHGKPACLADVVAYHQTKGDLASALGHRVTRGPRTKIYRKARVAINDLVSNSLIRDVSASGAMLEGVHSNGGLGADILIEMLDNEVVHGTIRWVSDGRLGVEFVEKFDLSKLTK